jgi:hypothetical protein
MIYKTKYLDELKLLSLPETGMGYQLITAKTTDKKEKTLFVVYNAEIILDFPKEFAKYQKDFISESYSTILNKIEFLNIESSSISLIPRIDISNYYSTLSANLTKNKGRKTGGKGAIENPKEHANGEEQFVRLSAYENDKRIDLINKRLLPGSYTTTYVDYWLCVVHKDDPVDRYALPNDEQIKCAFYIRPTKNDILQRGIVQPAFGHTGGGDEVYFEKGTLSNTYLCKKPYGQ